MNRNFILIGLLIYISALVNCDSISIENICKEDNFVLPNGFKVNSISRYQFNITFERRFRIFHDKNEQFKDQFKSEDKTKEAIEIKQLYNEKMNKIYSKVGEEYLNNPEGFKNIEKDRIEIEDLLNKANDLKKYLKKPNGKIFYGFFISSLKNGYNLLKTLDTIRRNQLELDDKNFELLSMSINELKRYIRQNNLDNLEYALDDISIYEIFVNYKITLKNRFVFNLNTNDINSSTGTLVVDILLPLHNKNYNYEKKKGCIKSNQLSKWYLRK